MEKYGRIKMECPSNRLLSQPSGSYSNFEHNVIQFTFTTELKPRISSFLENYYTDQIENKESGEISFENQNNVFETCHSQKESDNNNNLDFNALESQYQNQSTTIATTNKMTEGKGEFTIFKMHPNYNNFIQTTILHQSRSFK